MLPDRYTLENLKRGVKHPELLREEVKRVAPNPLKMGHNYNFKRKYGAGIDVTEERWDNLIIIDACRYDYFSKHCSIEGDLQKVVSKGAHSWEFLSENFLDKELHDTVYVTANPHATKLPDEIFYSVEYLFDHWNEHLGTVLPENVVEAAVEANIKHPNKKLIIHFMQPHEPHLGPTADEYRDELSVRGWNTPDESADTDGLLWNEVAEKGLLSDDTARQAYVETLEIVLENIENMLSDLDGKSVITSDHGQMFGERYFPLSSKIYGHPHDLYTEELCHVPWLEIPYNQRRDITSEKPIESENIDQAVVDDRLEALGYR